MALDTRLASAEWEEAEENEICKNNLKTSRSIYYISIHLLFFE